MSAGKLIQFFSMFTKLPVYVEDVRDQIIEMGIQDEIVFVPMHVSPRHLMGMTVRYACRPLYGERKNCTIIFYNVNVERSWQRLIICKELMHLFDSESVSTKSRSDFYALVEALFDPELPTDQLQINIQSFTDEVALLMALAVLFPHESREEIIRAHDSGRMTVGDIADEFDIPAVHVPMLLSKSWDAVWNLLVRFS